MESYIDREVTEATIIRKEDCIHPTEEGFHCYCDICDKHAKPEEVEAGLWMLDELTLTVFCPECYKLAKSEKNLPLIS